MREDTSDDNESLRSNVLVFPQQLTHDDVDLVNQRRTPVPSTVARYHDTA